MIAKLVTWGDTRAQAILRMRRALEEYLIVGVHTNIPFHQTLIDSHRFMAGHYDTRFVEERFSMEEACGKQDPHDEIAAIFAALVEDAKVHQPTQNAQRGECRTSNWKRAGRLERMRR
jgi:acetyl-CoA carboxylase biotin carboxylase subunit